MVDQERRDRIMSAWKAAGEPWAGMARRTSEIPWGFGLALDAFGLLDALNQYRSTSSEGSVVVGVHDRSLVVVNWGASETHDASFSFLPLADVDVSIAYQGARSDLDVDRWAGSVTFTSDQGTHKVELRHEADLEWARAVYEAATTA